jgi:enoyl-[acyl-carrier protein] reductase I
MIDNTGKNALLTGVRNDSSIAWAIAEKLAASGARITLAVAVENEAAISDMVLRMGYNNFTVIGMDIRSDTDVANAVKKVVATNGKIDYLLHAVANASNSVLCTTPPGTNDTVVPEYLDIPFADLIDSFDVSAYSLLRLVRCAMPYLNQQASILTLTYNASQRIFPGYAGMAINKAALENIVKYLSYHLGKNGIRINSISAGMILTTSSGGIKGVRTLRKIGKEASPLGNVQAIDVANTALYYFSPLSATVTGNNHFVDGGLNNMGIIV